MQSRRQPSAQNMDIFAHALWTAAAAVAVRPKLKQPIRVGWCVAWGVLPDLATFLIPAVVRIGRWLTGYSPTLLPDRASPRFDWVWPLYNATHSAVLFTLIFGAICLYLRRPPLEMLGWALHIVIDVFTHRGWFAVKFLWPLSDYHINGLAWETPWFLAANWGALAAVWLLLIVRMRSLARR